MHPTVEPTGYAPSTIHATGCGQSDAAVLPVQRWTPGLRPVFLIAGADSESGVRLPDFGACFTFGLYLFNNGDSPVRVYPPAGERINGLVVDQPVVIASQSLAQFMAIGATRWGAINVDTS